MRENYYFPFPPPKVSLNAREPGLQREFGQDVVFPIGNIYSALF